MSRRLPPVLCALLTLLLVQSASRAADLATPETSLDRYVAKPDPSYEWKLVHTTAGEGITTFVIDMKSQTWRSPEEVDRTLWQHYVNIVKPAEVKSDKAFLFITGGANGREAPQTADGMIEAFARDSHSVVVELKQVPNQPLVFGGDGRKRTEDDLIGYTWDKFMVTGDDLWPARLPMVKSAVRAMDTVQAFMASDEGGKVAINGFVVAGGSKRGWTTWLTAAVDPRVIAIAPLVIDVLNTHHSMLHHWSAYGFWAPAVGNYVQHKIVHRADTPEHAALMLIEDPFSYRARFTMPKYIVNAAGDEFFLPDSSQFYFDELPGEKYLRYVPNASHSLSGSDARESVLAFYETVINNRPRPKFSWKLEDDGAIRVTVEDKPREVNLWQATNPKARDFRLQVIGKAYTSSPLAEESTNVYVGKVPAPEKGFTAYFVELVYDSGETNPFKFTTNVRVVPDVLPHKDKPRPTLNK